MTRPPGTRASRALAARTSGRARGGDVARSRGASSAGGVDASTVTARMIGSGWAASGRGLRSAELVAHLRERPVHAPVDGGLRLAGHLADLGDGEVRAEAQRD